MKEHKCIRCGKLPRDSKCDVNLCTDCSADVWGEVYIKTQTLEKALRYVIRIYIVPDEYESDEKDVKESEILERLLIRFK